jgi:hypothetical protein
MWHADGMTDPRTPARLRRAKLTKRAQLVLALAAAAFALYRIAAVFFRSGGLPR